MFLVKIHQTDGEFFGAIANSVIIITAASNLKEAEK